MDHADLVTLLAFAIDVEKLLAVLVCFPALRDGTAHDDVCLRCDLRLSNFRSEKPLDLASLGWRGSTCIHGEARVRDSGLWNQRHVDEPSDPAFLDALERMVDRTPLSR
jgi:hypothetical protein